MIWVHLAIIFISGLGSFTGMALARIAPEELEDGHKFFLGFFAIMAALAITTAIKPVLNAQSIIIGAVVFVALWKIKIPLWISYSIAALSVPISILNGNLGTIAITSVAVFLAGMPAGTLVVEKEKTILDAFKKSVILLPSLIVNILIYLIF